MPPDNGQYLMAAYIVAGVIYLAYAVKLIRQAKR